MKKEIPNKGRFLNISVALFLGALVFYVPVWLFGAQANLPAAKAQVISHSVHGLIARDKRPGNYSYLSDSKGEIYSFAKTDADAVAYALDLNCLFTGEKPQSKFQNYYATYPTRAAAEAAGQALEGSQIDIRYDPQKPNCCVLQTIVDEDTKLVPIFQSLVAVFLIGAILTFAKSILTFKA